MPQFDISSFTSQLFWLGLIFSVLYFVVSKVIVPKAEQILSSRDKWIDDNLELAKKYNEQARLLEMSNKDSLTKLNKDIESARKEALDAQELKFKKKKEELADEIRNKQKESLKEIDDYKNSFQNDVEKIRINLSAFIIEKITGKTANIKLLEEIEKEKNDSNI